MNGMHKSECAENGAPVTTAQCHECAPERSMTLSLHEIADVLCRFGHIRAYQSLLAHIADHDKFIDMLNEH